MLEARLQLWKDFLHAIHDTDDVRAGWR